MCKQLCGLLFVSHLKVLSMRCCSLVSLRSQDSPISTQTRVTSSAIWILSLYALERLCSALTIFLLLIQPCKNDRTAQACSNDNSHLSSLFL